MSELYYVELVLFAVLAAAFLLVAIYLLRSYRQRRLEAMRKDGSNPALAGDRAYNRLALARREAALLEAQGVDVERARQLIELSNRSLEGRNPDRAFELAQAAHETLVVARREPRRLPGSPSPSSSVPQVPVGDPSLPAAMPGTGGPSTGPTAPSPPLPSEAEKAAVTSRDKAEAQFQLRLFEEDLASASKGPRTGRAAAEAKQLYVDAHAAFAKGDYAQAFRLSLRGRRSVGGNVETLGPPSAAPSHEGAVASAASPEAAAEAVAALDRCPECGYPKVAGDGYCRGCGAAHAPPTCPACQAPRAPSDTFCGKCGARFGTAG